MIVQCSSCGTRYHYDESRFGSAVAKRIRCTKCSTIFEIQNPLHRPSASGSFRANPLSDDFTLDVTALGGPRRKPPSSEPPGPTIPRLTMSRPIPRPVPSSAAPAGASRPITHPFDDPPAPTQPTPPSAMPNPAVAANVKETKRLKLPEHERLSLACIAGPDSGKIFEIDKPRVVLGRANADILLSDGECSRQHAAIEVLDERAVLIDLGSTNGTFVHENRVTELELSDKSEFDVGSSTLMFIRSRRD